MACEYCGATVELHPYRSKEFHYCSMSCRAKANPRPRDRVDKTCPRCGKVFEVKRGQADTAVYCSISCASIGRITGSKAPWWKGGVKPTICKTCGKEFVEKYRNKAKYCSQSCYRRGRPTSIEQAIQNALSVKGVYFVPEYRIGKYGIDIFIPSANLAVECDGDYWHKNTKERDEKKDAELTRQGIRVLRFSETEINKNLAHCVNTILSYLS
jgi:very-short-patch-repair endonuclease